MIMLIFAKVFLITMINIWKAFGGNMMLFAVCSGIRCLNRSRRLWLIPNRQSKKNLTLL